MYMHVLCVHLSIVYISVISFSDTSGRFRGGGPGVQWNPHFGRVLRNYEGFVVVLRVIGALAIVNVTLSLSVLAFMYTRAPITRA